MIDYAKNSVDLWYNQIINYNFANGGTSNGQQFMSFTQLNLEILLIKRLFFKEVKSFFFINKDWSGRIQTKSVGA